MAYEAVAYILLPLFLILLVLPILYLEHSKGPRTFEEIRLFIATLFSPPNRRAREEEAAERWEQEEKRRADEAQQAEEPTQKPARNQTEDFDPHAVLKVPRGASGEEIRTAYLRELGRYHPDKVSHLGDEFQQIAAEKTREIIKAYEILKKSV